MCAFACIHVGICEMRMAPPTHLETHETMITNMAQLFLPYIRAKTASYQVITVTSHSHRSVNSTEHYFVL